MTGKFGIGIYQGLTLNNVKMQNVNPCFGPIQSEGGHTTMASISQNHSPSGSEPGATGGGQGP